MGFIGSSCARELDAQTDLQQPPDPIDYEIEIDYELELELAAEESESDDEPDSESEYLEALQQSNNTSDLFEFCFREQARRAFLDRGN